MKSAPPATPSDPAFAPRRRLVLQAAWTLGAPGAAWAQTAVSGPASTAAAAKPPAVAARPAAGSQPAGLPVAAVRPVPDTAWGVTLQDPYRYFENPKAPEVAAWMKAHSDHAHRVLQGLAGRAELRQRLERYDGAAAARVAEPVRLPGGLVFYERRGARDDQFKLYLRRGLQGAEKLLFDPEVLRRRTGKPHAINWFAPSPDGRHVALGVSAGGSEEAVMRVLDTTTLRQVGPLISRVDFGAVAWLPDGSGFFFHRMQAMAPGMPETDKYQRSMVMFSRLGGSEAALRTVVRAGVDAEVPATEFPILQLWPHGQVLLRVEDGVSPDFAGWHSTLAEVMAGKPAWRRLFGREDLVIAATLVQGRVTLLSTAGAPRGKVLGGALQGFSPATAAVRVPEASRVLAGLVAAADALYLEAREGNVKKLLRLPHGDGGTPQDVPLPVLGAFQFGPRSADPRLGGVWLELESWTRARQIFAVEPEGRVTNTGLQPTGPYDAPGNIVATEVMVKSHDGAEVPMSIIHQQGVRLDGSNPTLLYGYASYGITEEPFFSISRLAWMEAGGVFAVANPRGSGVFGRQWHEDGKQATKPNSWRDFIACAEHLVAQGWTRPARLAIWGGSAGGILVGRAMTERPDLFAAVVPEVGALDMVRAEFTPNGVPNIPEFGSRATEAGFRALLAMCTYHQIRDGVRYPAVLLTHGVNDPRVEVWNSTKTAARLMAASTSGKPVLLRLDYDSGHGIGSTKTQVLDERADLFAFLLWQMGVAGYGPRA